MSTLQTIVAAFVADAVALAVSFGVNISTGQQAALLAFVGSTTTAIAAIVVFLETHKLRSKALVAAGTTAAIGSDAAKQVTAA